MKSFCCGLFLVLHMCSGIGEQDVAALAVRCERHVVDVTEAQQGVDVRLVRLGRQRVARR